MVYARLKSKLSPAVIVLLMSSLVVVFNLCIISLMVKGKSKYVGDVVPGVGKSLPFGKSRGLIYLGRALHPITNVNKLADSDRNEPDRSPVSPAEDTTKRNTGYLSNETLQSLFGSRLLKPGTEEEAMAGRLMAIRRHPVVNAFNYEFTINPFHACTKEAVEVVLCVITAIQNFPARRQFRYSIKGGYAGIWNKVSRSVLLFFVGALPPKKTKRHKNIQASLNNESLTHGDIVQAAYIDSYRNLSLKTVSVLKWVTTYCSHAKFLIKTDDDCDVNIPLMITELHKMQKVRPLFMLGKVSRKKTPLRDPKSKWYIPRSLYKEDKYPTFLYGGSQGYPVAVAKLLYETSLRIPIFWLEDVYISGLCAFMANIPRIDTTAFYFSHFIPADETEY